MSNDVDKIISTEISDPQEDPILFVVKNTIHGPCGTINPTFPCMKECKCTKNYPRNLIKETQTEGEVLKTGKVTKIKVKVGNSYREF